jgi:DNA-binding GntR family transcriptional regulator
MARQPKSTNLSSEEPSIRLRAYQYIQRKIASGEFRGGSPISELSIAKELGTSRTPIREATGQLIAEGLLEQGQAGGVVVTRLTRQDIIDLYELREALEVFAVGRAAQKPMRPSDEERLRSIHGVTTALIHELEVSGQKELDLEQMRRFTAADLGFHAMLIRMAANVRILKVVNETRLLIRIFSIRRSGHSKAELEQIDRHHCEILNAVMERDRQRVMAVLSEHIQTSQRERIEEFDYWEREASLRSSLPEFPEHDQLMFG